MGPEATDFLGGGSDDGAVEIGTSAALVGVARGCTVVEADRSGVAHAAGCCAACTVATSSPGVEISKRGVGGSVGRVGRVGPVGPVGRVGRVGRVGAIATGEGCVAASASTAAWCSGVAGAVGASNKPFSTRRVSASSLGRDGGTFAANGEGIVANGLGAVLVVFEAFEVEAGDGTLALPARGEGEPRLAVTGPFLAASGASGARAIMIGVTCAALGATGNGAAGALGSGVTRLGVENALASIKLGVLVICEPASSGSTRSIPIVGAESRGENGAATGAEAGGNEVGFGGGPGRDGGGKELLAFAGGNFWGADACAGCAGGSVRPNGLVASRAARSLCWGSGGGGSIGGCSLEGRSASCCCVSRGASSVCAIPMA